MQLELVEHDGDEVAGLPFTEANISASSSILLIHGGSSSGAEWHKFVPLLSSYHLILPDLPANGRAAAKYPKFSIQQSSELLADIVRKHGKHAGKARVVGFSLGARVAVDLISRFPDIVDEDAVVSGYGVFKAVGPTALASFFWLESRVEQAVPAAVISWLMDGQEPAKDGSSSSSSTKRSFADYKAMAEAIASEEWPQPWPARTLIFAAGKSGILPTADPAGDNLRLRDIGRQGNAQTAAYTHADMRHPWLHHQPAVFAELVLAWFEKRALPEGFKTL